MSALLFFSGGIDSAVIATILAQQPEMYGISSTAPIILLAHASPGERAKKEKRLAQLARACFTAYGSHRYELEVVEMPLHEHDQLPIGSEGHSGQPLITKWKPDRDSCPYTSGLHMALASLAVNRLAFLPRPTSGFRTAFWGFQEDNLAWEAQDAGKLPKNDASEAWVKSLNGLMGQSPTKTRFRAPFLESRLSKYQIVQLAQRLGTPLKLTSSCIYGWEGCGRCWQCNRRANVFRALAISE